MGQYKIVVHDVSWAAGTRSLPIVLGQTDNFRILVPFDDGRYPVTVDGLSTVAVLTGQAIRMLLNGTTMPPAVYLSLPNANMALAIDSGEASSSAVTYAEGQDTLNLQQIVPAMHTLVTASSERDNCLVLGCSHIFAHFSAHVEPKPIAIYLDGVPCPAFGVVYAVAEDVAVLRDEVAGLAAHIDVVGDDTLLLSMGGKFVYANDLQQADLADARMLMSADNATVTIYGFYYLYDWENSSLSSVADLTLADMMMSEVIE